MLHPKRPYIPILVRLQVAMRQLRAADPTKAIDIVMRDWWSERPLAVRLKIVLYILGFRRPQLDHVPALARRHRNKRTGRYTPDANDPEFLQWIDAADHLEKTAGRGGEKMRIGGDTREAAKTKRLEDRRAGVVSKSRGRKTVWPKGQKIQSRGFQKRG
jgi:hypothetical protein